jgi:hypothetical protein
VLSGADADAGDQPDRLLVCRERGVHRQRGRSQRADRPADDVDDRESAARGSDQDGRVVATSEDPGDGSMALPPDLAGPEVDEGDCGRHGVAGDRDATMNGHRRRVSDGPVPAGALHERQRIQLREALIRGDEHVSAVERDHAAHRRSARPPRGLCPVSMSSLRKRRAGTGRFPQPSLK